MTLKQRWCTWVHRDRSHGVLVAAQDALWTYCPRCGCLSPGITFDTRWVRVSWRYAQHRLRFKKAA